MAENPSLNSFDLSGELSGHDAEVSHIAFSPDGHYLASTSHDVTVRVWRLSERKFPECVAVLHGHRFCTMDVSWSPDGN
eukprot:CAMPEP_0170191662 /NCGR_PEP_ID=MMETSP0040_2-20121228/52239_1 /TAXON_ID=641309 /ORGANISM="Lotharella oceanica, Strain CCMP622" /LENGTH=78 /DNA_ID=CAMNT_0010439803 /DNA_START=1 /DNA_END=234 /DNA_ORIENTATION=+